GYNDDGGPTSKTINGSGYQFIVVGHPSSPIGVWQRDQRFRLRDYAPGGTTITEVRIGGGGWDFEGRADNLRIWTSFDFADTFTDGVVFDDWEWFKYTSGLHGPVVQPTIQSDQLVIPVRDQQISWVYRPDDRPVQDYRIRYVGSVDRLFDDAAGTLSIAFAIDTMYIGPTTAPRWNGYHLQVIRRDQKWKLLRYDATAGVSLLDEGPLSVSLGQDYDVLITVEADAITLDWGPVGGSRSRIFSILPDPTDRLGYGGVALGGGDGEAWFDQVYVCEITGPCGPGGS
ncbi:MAG: hypothetical protein R3324_20880, partial [Halobacteriales archaeon]|nr:hypothetical protein [Halobacteriales archaeon]